SFTDFNVEASAEENDFSNAEITFTANTSSVSTNNEQRDGHLKSGDFFDVEKYPTITFKSTQTANIGNEIKGDLTIKDVTKNITLNVEFGGVTKDPYGNTKAGFTVIGKINRKDF